MFGRRRFSIKSARKAGYRYPNWLRWLAAGLVMIFLITFRGEIFRLLASGWRLLRFMTFPDPAAVATGQYTPVLGTGISFWILIENIAMLAVFVFAGLWLASQFVLPVRDFEERDTVFHRLQLYAQGIHGAAIFVKEGVIHGNQSEIGKVGPGVVFVDHSSAVVLEKVPGAYYPTHLFDQIRILIRGLYAPDPDRLETRALGPGVVFTEAGERVRGAVDLRNQVRLQSDVQAFTRDGIAVNTRIFCLFTLGQAPDVLRVGFTGEELPENLRVIQLNEEIMESQGEDEDRRVRVQVIKNLTDELDDDDRLEIYRYFQSTRTSGIVYDQPPLPRRADSSPFVFDEERVKAAVYSAARNIEENTVSAWTELPPQVATEIFRDMLLERNFDDWYAGEDNQPQPIRAAKGLFSQKVRNQGMLSFQLIERVDHFPLAKDQVWDENFLLIHPVRPLRTQKVLRERGIKVIAAGFSELEPVSPVIREQMLRKWQARWQQQVEITRASYELEAMKIKNAARARAQQEMVYTLSDIMRNPRYSQEAVALRLFQALESFAYDSATRKLLPEDTIRMLWTIGGLMKLRDEEGGDSLTQPFPGADNSGNPDRPGAPGSPRTTP